MYIPTALCMHLGTSDVILSTVTKLNNDMLLCIRMRNMNKVSA